MSHLNSHGLTAGNFRYCLVFGVFPGQTAGLAVTHVGLLPSERCVSTLFQATNCVQTKQICSPEATEIVLKL